MSTEIARTNPPPQKIARERIATVAFSRDRWTDRKAENWLSKEGFKRDVKDFSDPEGGNPGYLYYEQAREVPGRKYKWVNIGREDRGIFAIVDAGRDMTPGGPAVREARTGPEFRRRPARRMNPEIQAAALQIARMALEDDGFRRDVESEFGMSRSEIIALREELEDHLS